MTDAELSSLADEVALAGSPVYDTVRRPAMGRFQHVRPRAIVRCATAAEVARTISFARRSGCEIAVRSGGHCFAGRSSTTGILIDLGPMCSVSMSDGIVEVGAGARLGDVYDALEPHGLTVAAGCGPTVGIAGLTLGGGLGILGRRYGLTSDQLVGAQVVLADGHVVDCDERRDEDLFWALRGAGGGQFGVVTKLVLRTVPAPAMTCFKLGWPIEDAPGVIEAWQASAPFARDELAASLLVTVPADPQRAPVATVFGAMAGAQAETEEELHALAAAAGATPASFSLEELPHRQAKRYLAEQAPGAAESEEPESPKLDFSKSEFFRAPLPGDAVAGLVGGLVEGRAPGHARELDFTPWAGAYNRVPPDATAFVHRQELFLLKQAAVLDVGVPAAAVEAERDWLARSWALVHPWGSGGVYPNFPDPDLDDPWHAYHGANLNRLARAKARYDPDNFFRFDQSLQPAGPANGPSDL